MEVLKVLVVTGGIRTYGNVGSFESVGGEGSIEIYGVKRILKLLELIGVLEAGSGRSYEIFRKIRIDGSSIPFNTLINSNSAITTPFFTSFT